MAATESQTLQDQAYQTLRQAIIFTKLKPGERLVPKELCAELDLGRTPVREAIVRLQQEGLVRTVPQSGTYVSKIDMHAEECARFSREQLEKQVAVECCARASEDDLARIDDVISQQTKAVSERNERAFFVTDNLMHEAIFEIADRREVWDWLSLTNAHFERFRWLSAITTGVGWSEVMEQHHQIRDAIATHNTNEISYLVTLHLHKALSDKQEVILAHPEYFEDEDREEIQG